MHRIVPLFIDRLVFKFWAVWPYDSALFTVVKIWKQAKYPLTVEWIKMWYIYICVCVHIYIFIYVSCSVCIFICMYIYMYIYSVVKISVTQSCPTLCNTMDYSPPGSSVHGILQARILEWVAILFSRKCSQLRESNLDLQHCMQILHHLSHQGRSKNTGVGRHSLSKRSSWPRGQTQDFSIAGRFFTIWTTREATR